MCLYHTCSIYFRIAICNLSFTISGNCKFFIASDANWLHGLVMYWMSFAIVHLSIPLDDFSIWGASECIFSSFNPFDCKQRSFLLVFRLLAYIGYKFRADVFPVFARWLRLAYGSLDRKLKFPIASFLRVYDWSIALIKVILFIVLIIDFRSSIIVIALILRLLISLTTRLRLKLLHHHVKLFVERVLLEMSWAPSTAPSSSFIHPSRITTVHIC